jgi:hypothetical protein
MVRGGCAEGAVHGRHVRRQSCQPQIRIAVGEDLGEVVGDSEGLHSEAQVAADSDAVLADPISITTPVSSYLHLQ